MKDELYWELEPNQLSEWLTIQGEPLMIDYKGNKVPHLPTEDLKVINQIIDPFRSKKKGTNEGGPVIYPAINTELSLQRSGYCWFLEKPLLHFKGYFAESELMIHKFADDWFLVRWEDNPVSWNRKTRWFVCDEITGVVRLLKNLF